jgi:hypothetical protein
MPYVTPSEIARAREMDLLTWLQNYEPDNLVHFSGSTYCTREHDSLKISNGKWNWFSRGIGGRSALDYLIKVRGFSLPEAVEAIIGRQTISPPVFHAQPEAAKALILPEAAPTADKVVSYLMGRGIHPVVIDYCLKNKLLYESLPYHSAVFVGYDHDGEARYAAVRGTRGDFKGEAAGSDKRFAFSITANQNPGRLHLFEAAIDLLSYATLEVLAGRDWKQDAYLSLAGVYKGQRRYTVPLALQEYLQHHPDIQALALHLDNDEVGRAAAEDIKAELGGKFQVLDEPPSFGKDVNDQLKKKLGIYQRKEEQER